MQEEDGDAGGVADVVERQRAAAAERHRAGRGTGGHGRGTYTRSSAVPATRLTKTGGHPLDAADTDAAAPTDHAHGGRPHPEPAAAVTATHLAIAAVGAYVGAQVIANVASVKIGSTFGRAVDMGTFVYPITFTLRDVVHKTLGKRLARTVVLTAAGVNLFLAVYLQWVVRVRPDAATPSTTSSGRCSARCGASWWPRSSPR